MSIPKNHHYVSQCHIRHFFNEHAGELFLYDKQLDNYFSKGTTKSVFSENELNTKVVEDVIDHTSLEEDLKKSFEDDFNRHVKVVEELTESPKNANPTFKDSIRYLAKYGIAGEIRTPFHKRETDESLLEGLTQFMLKGIPTEASRGYLRKNLFKSKYSNHIKYSEFAELVLKSMGDFFAKIYFLKGDDYFLLPDRPSVTRRAKINTYNNPNIEEIAMIGIPLTSKIFLYIESRKLSDNKDSIVSLNPGDSLITVLNTMLYMQADKQVACQNEKYLKDFVKSLKPKS